MIIIIKNNQTKILDLDKLNKKLKEKLANNY